MQPREALGRIGPAVEPVPSLVEVPQARLVEVRHLEARQDALEVAPVEDIELGERDLTRADLLHRGLILIAPGVREGEPVERVAHRLEDELALPRDRRAPIHDRAEHIEDESLDWGGVEHGCFLMVFRRSLPLS